MITEQDLQEAIAECQGKRNPDASTCIKLAAFLTIQKEMFGPHEQNISHPTYSYAAPNIIDRVGDTDFLRMVYGADTNDVLGVIDELMTTLQVINPRLYAGVMRRLASQHPHQV